MFLNVLTFYKGTWNMLPLIVPIPSAVGKVMTQGSLPAALLVAWSANRRMLIRPNVFLGLLTLLFIEALISGIYPVGHIVGTLYRTVRLGEFVAVLWLLSPLVGPPRPAARQMPAHGARRWCSARCCSASSMSPHRALAEGRLSGEFWPITPVQVADFSAVALGLVVVLWFCGEMPGRRALAVVAVARGHAAPDPYQDRGDRPDGGPPRRRPEHVRGQARVRRLFASRAHHGVGRGHRVLQRADDLAGPRPEHAAADGPDRPDDGLDLRGQRSARLVPGDLRLRPVRQGVQTAFPSTATGSPAYYDLGLAGACIVAAMLLFVLVNAYFQPRSERRALALFLVTYLLVTSFTETGLSDASMYLLELALAASLLRAARSGQEPGMRVLLVHNRYRSATPSGENRVVDQEGEALAGAGHEVMRFGRDSDEIEHWSPAKKAALPARVVWSREARRDLAAALRRIPARRRRTCTTRFPCSAPLSCTPAGTPAVPVVATLHNYRLVVRQRRLLPSGHRLSRLHAPPSRCRGSCTAATGDRARPPRRWSWPTSRTARRGGRWSRPTCSSPRPSATCTPGSACLRTGFSSGTT